MFWKKPAPGITNELVAQLKAKFYDHRIDGTDRYRELIRSEFREGGVT